MPELSLKDWRWRLREGARRRVSWAGGACREPEARQNPAVGGLSTTGVAGGAQNSRERLEDASSASPEGVRGGSLRVVTPSATLGGPLAPRAHLGAGNRDGTWLTGPGES